MSAEKLKKKKAKTGEKKNKGKSAERSIAPLAAQKKPVRELPAPGKLKYCVVGSGAIGGIIAAYLQNAMRKVYIVAKPDHVRALRMDGLRIDGVQETVFVEPRVKERMDENVDVAIIAVKTQDIQTVLDINRNYLEDVTILTVQHGVRAEKIIGSKRSNRRILFPASLCLVQRT